MFNVKKIFKGNKVAAAAVSLGLLGTVAMGVAMTPAMSGFTASINNSTNTVGTGTLLMTESQGATTCLSSAAGTVTATNAGTCATINKLGGATTAVPGSSYTASVTIKNNGTVPANTFTLTPAGCNVLSNGTVNGSDTSGFCGKVDLTIADTTGAGTCVFPASTSACAAPTSANTLTSLGTSPIALTTPLAPGASRSYTFTILVDSSANNNDQGLLASEPLLWSFAS